MVRPALAVTAALLSLATPPVRAAEPKPFHSEAGGYSVRFPSAPRETADARPDGVKQHLALATDAARTRSFVVSWADLFLEAAVQPERALDDAMKGLVKPGGKVVSKREVRISRLPARAFHVVQPNGLIVHGQIVVRGDARLYLVMAAGRGELSAAEVEPFLASFSLDGPGIPEYPVDPAPRRVAFPPAAASLLFHGAPEQGPMPGGKEGETMLVAKPRGGFRTELALFSPLVTKTPLDRQKALDGLVVGFGKQSGGVSGQRALEVGRWPARDFTFTQGARAGFVRAIATERGVLMLQLIAPPGTVKDEEVSAFRESVRFEPGR